MAKIKFICKICEKNVETIKSILKKSISMKTGCCSFFCFKKTEEYRERRKISDEIRVRKIRETGNFSKNGLLSSISRSKKFLDGLNISYTGLSDSEIFQLWKKEFREKSNHREKIRRGREQKYPDADARKKADKERVLKGSCKIIGIDYQEDFTETERAEITRKAYENFRVKDSRSWKIKHLIKNSNIDFNELSNEKINTLYSEYISERYKRSSLECDRNGYLKSLKGWYELINQPGDRHFYRSSWERKIFETLDILLGEGKIKRVICPERIQYIFEGVKRHYYPDAAFVSLHDETIVLEIKPKSKIEQRNNVEKISQSKIMLGNRFHVLTEEDIFEKNLMNILETM